MSGNVKADAVAAIAPLAATAIVRDAHAMMQARPVIVISRDVGCRAGLKQIAIPARG